MLVYHGSPNKFDKFDYNKIGENGTAEGFGFYFTDKKSIAENYAGSGYIYTVELKGKELSGTEMTITEKQFRKLALHLNKKGEYLSNFGEVAYDGLENVLRIAVETEYESSEDDAELIGGIINAYGDKEGVLQAAYKLLGYGFIKDNEPKWGHSNGNQTVYVALANEVIEVHKIEKVEN